MSADVIVHEDLDAAMAADQAELEAARAAPAETPTDDATGLGETAQDAPQGEETAPETTPADDDEGSTDKRLARAFHKARQKEQEADKLRQELARLRGERGPETPDAQVERLANERAEQIATQKQFNAQCTEVANAGNKAYPDFRAKMQAMWDGINGGYVAVPLVEAALEAGNAHAVLHWLGSNLDEAERIAALPPSRQGAAVAKIAAKIAAPKVTASKAPPPIKPIVGRGKAEPNLETMPIEEFMRLDREKYQARFR